MLVTSLVEVWIEIHQRLHSHHHCMVTSLVEVWIEILVEYEFIHRKVVTSLVEVWIEILDRTLRRLCKLWSLPLWKCGLKLQEQKLVYQ